MPMGPEGDPACAVDSRGRVRGVQGLYVADASIMPTIPSYNINLPTLMIGERFGEWVQRDELYRDQRAARAVCSAALACSRAKRC